MSSSAETRRIVEKYFTAWTTKNVSEAYACLSPDLEFYGPTASYTSAEAFLPALQGFAAMTRSVKLLELFADGDRAAMLYDCELPFGTVRIASLFRVEGETIRWYDTRFDATELRKLQSRS